MTIISQSVSWCFEPSQPQRVTSGLKTNLGLSTSHSWNADTHALKHHYHHHHHHQFLNREGRWGTTDDFATSFLHFPCSPLPSGTCRTPGLSIPWCCLPTSSSICLVFFSLSLCLARCFWPDLMNGQHDHTTAVNGKYRDEDKQDPPPSNIGASYLPRRLEFYLL